MGRLTLCHPDRCAGATLSGGSWQTYLPRDNLKSLPLGSVARTTDAALASTEVRLDLGMSRAIGVLALCAHNLRSTALYRVQGSSVSTFSSAVHDSGWLDVWPSLWSTEAMDWEDDRWWDGKITEEERAGYTANLIHLLPAEAYARYWRLLLNDTTNPDGYVQAGRLILAQAWQPSVNHDWGAKLGYDTDTGTETALGGTRYFDVRPARRSFSCQLSWLDSDEAYGRILEMMRALGIHGELFVLTEPDDAVNILRRNFLATLRQLNAIEAPYLNAHSVALEFTEVL